MKYIGISGRKQSGKSTLFDFLNLNAHKLFDRDEYEAGFKFWPDIRKFPFAEPLKQFCINVLGLDYKQVYGSDDDKETFTKFKWENLPHYPRIVSELREKITAEVREEQRSQYWIERVIEDYPGMTADLIENRVAMRSPIGFMTGRQVMQEVGTGVFRQMYSDVWVDAWGREVEKYDNMVDVGVADDARFANEIRAIHGRGGVVLRLKRKVSEDTHESEVALDTCDIFDLVVPEDATIKEMCLTTYELLRSKGMAKDVDVDSLAIPGA